jgi:hypothetical protein
MIVYPLLIINDYRGIKDGESDEKPGLDRVESYQTAGILVGETFEFVRNLGIKVNRFTRLQMMVRAP